ncbi:MAG: SAM-dependent methyltransferase [Acidobacteria bacterium]|nr:MAG: SAM-dependent methyltransferase [Acidobacteriota bacterium]
MRPFFVPLCRLSRDMCFADHLRRKIQQKGPIPFSDYMEEVVRHYYSSERNPIGIEGDFYTAPDLDPILAELLAKQFEEMARAFESFTLVELGAGKGVLARDVLRHRRFPYMILERSPGMRRRQAELLKEYDVTWIEELPNGITGCIFSNEFFDALPVHRVVRRGRVLKEIYVTEDFEEIEADLQEPIEAPLAEGQFADINLEARSWIRRIGESLDAGYHLAIDYGYLRDEYYAQPRGTLMCYWRHQAVEDPYLRIGEQDITAHVNFSDLMEEGTAASLDTVRFTTQMDYLIGLGILNEVERLASAGDAVSLQRLLKVKKLILPGSMGERFKVLIQAKRRDERK